MANNFLHKRKRITHIRTLGNASAAEDAGLPNAVDYVNDIIKGMDLNNKSDSKTLSDEYLHDITLKKIQKHMLMKNEKKPDSYAPSDADNNSNAKIRKFLAPQQRFPLMAKCQKSLKYLQHNRKIPKQRAHVNQLHESPLKSSKTKLHELHKLNKVKFNEKYKRTDLELKKKTGKSADNICNSQFLHQKKSRHENSKKKNNSVPSPLHKNSLNVGNIVTEICGNSSSDSDGEFENFLKRHAPVSSKSGVLKKKSRSSNLQTKPKKNSVKRTVITSRKLSSFETDTENNKHNINSDHESFEKFHKKSKIDYSLPTDFKESTCLKHESKPKNEVRRKDLKNETRKKETGKSRVIDFFKEKSSVVLKKDLSKEPEKGNFNLYSAQNDVILSSPESNCGSVVSQTFECDDSDFSEKSSGHAENTRYKKKLKRKRRKSISKESTDNNNLKLLSSSSSEEELDEPYSNTSHKGAEQVQHDKQNIRLCTVLLERDSCLDSLLSEVKEFDLNSKKKVSGLEKSELNRENCEIYESSNEYCNLSNSTSGDENIYEQTKNVENNTNIQIAAVCSLANMEDSDVIYTSDSGDCENRMSDKTSDSTHKVKEYKDNNIKCSGVSEQHISKEYVRNVPAEFSNRNEVLLKEQNGKKVELSSTNKELSQTVHKEINETAIQESEKELSDVEIIEIKSVANISIKPSVFVSQHPLRKTDNIPVKRDDLNATNSFHNELNDQNSSHVSGSREIPEHVSLEVSQDNVISIKSFEPISKDAKQTEKGENYDKAFYINTDKCFQDDVGDNTQNRQHNSESDDDCVIIQEKNVKSLPGEKSSVLSDGNVSEIFKKADSNIITEVKNNFESSQVACNVLKRNESKSSLFAEGIESYAEGSNQHCDRKSSDHQNLQSIKNEPINDKCVSEPPSNSKDAEIDELHIAPDLFIVQKLKKYFDLNGIGDWKMHSEEKPNANREFSDSHLACSREFGKENDEISKPFRQGNLSSTNRIGSPDMKNLKNENLDDSISDLERFVSAEDPNNKRYINAAQLYKLYQKELLHYDEIKLAEKNVEIGLKLLEEKQRKKIAQLAYMLKVCANMDPCFQKICETTIKQEMNEVEVERELNCKKIDGSQLNKQASQLNLSSTCAKNEDETFNSADAVSSPHFALVKDVIHCPPSTSKEVISRQQSKVSASSLVGTSSDDSKEHLRNLNLSSSDNSSFMRNCNISSVKILAKEKFCNPPSTSQDVVNRQESSARISIGTSSVESKEHLRNLTLSAASSSFGRNSAIPSTKKVADKVDTNFKEKKAEDSSTNKYCALCQKPGLFACRGCQKVCFCSQQCGITFWDKGHKDQCSV